MSEVESIIAKIEEEINAPKPTDETPEKTEIKADGTERKNMADDQTKETAPAPASPPVEKTVETAGDGWIPNMDELKEMKEKVTALEAKIGGPDSISREAFDRHAYAITEVDMGAHGEMVKEDVAELSARGMASLGATNNFNFDLVMDEAWVNGNSLPYNADNIRSLAGSTVAEAIAYTGAATDSTGFGNRISITDRVKLLPGGKYLKSIRNLVYFSQLDTGVTEITRPKGNIPDAKNLTEGDGSDADNGANEYDTHELDLVKLTANPVTGNVQHVEKSDMENTPQAIFEYMATASRAEVLDHEARLIFRELLSDRTSTPINGNTRRAINFATKTDKRDFGAVINGAGEELTADNKSDDLAASEVPELGFEALVKTLAIFQDLGYDAGFGDIKCVIHPDHLAQLKVDQELQRYLQQGEAVLSKTGRLTYFQGIELIPMNILRPTGTGTATNHNIAGSGDRTGASVFRAYAFVAGHSFWLGSHRTMTINTLYQPRRLSYDWSWSQRKDAAIFDPLSIVQISSDATGYNPRRRARDRS